MTGHVEEATSTTRESEWACSGLRELLSAGPRRTCLGLVDLGAISAAAFALYSRLTPRIQVADLLAGASGGPAAGGLLPAEAAMRVLEGLAESSQSLALCWECLDYLSPATSGRVVAALARALHQGGRLHLLVASSGRLPLQPRRFFPEPDGRLRVLEEADAPWFGRRDLAPAEFERRLLPFVVEHSVLLREGVREVVAVLP